MTAQTRGVVQRKALPMTERDLADLAMLRSEESPQRRALRELSGGELGMSEAAVLHALIEVGLRAVKEAARDEGYAALAASRTPEDVAELRALRERRRARTADEE